jgi:hypothetical protein
MKKKTFQKRKVGKRKEPVASEAASDRSLTSGALSMLTSRISRFVGCSVVVSMVTSRISRFVGCSVLRRCS